jgi:RNA polymerase sigma factor (sigma-70 family)
MSLTLSRLRRLTGDPAPDGPLLAAYLAGSQDAFRELIERHATLVFGVCQRILQHRQDAEDAFQAVFIVLGRRAGEVWPRDAVGSWLYGVATRVAVKARTLRTRRQAREQPLTDMAAAIALAPEPDLADIINRVLGKLPEVYRAAIVACDLEGLSRRDAALRLGWTEGTLSSRLARARKLLADRLRKNGTAFPAAGLSAALGTNATVHGRLIQTTLELAFSTASIPAQLGTLTKGVTSRMFLIKQKTMAAVALIASAVGFGAWTAGAGDGPDGPTTTAQAAPQPQPANQSKCVFFLKNADAQLTATLLHNLFTPQTSETTGGGTALVGLQISVDDRTNSIEVLGTQKDLETVKSIILKLDAADTPDRFYDVFKLRNAVAADVATALTSFISNALAVYTDKSLSASNYHQIQKNVVIVAEPVSNTILISAPPFYFLEMKRLIERIDAQPTDLARMADELKRLTTEVADLRRAGDHPPEDVMKRIQRVEQRLAELRGSLAEARVAGRPQNHLEAEQVLQDARAAAMEAYARYEIAKAQVARAQANVDVAQSNLLQAQSQVEAAQKKAIGGKPSTAEEKSGKGITIYVRPRLAPETALPLDLKQARTVLEGLVYVCKAMTIKTGDVSVWVVREKQALPVDLVAITSQGNSTTNYQLQEGDKLFVQAK